MHINLSSRNFKGKDRLKDLGVNGMNLRCVKTDLKNFDSTRSGQGQVLGSCEHGNETFLFP